MYFNKKQDPYPPCGAHAAALALNTPKVRPRSHLEPSANVTGDLWSDGDVQIDGHLCGNINCAQLIVGQDAAVTGVIIAEEAVIRGKFTGIIRAARVLLQHTARVESEIVYQSLSIDEGARFEGVARPCLDPLREEIAVSPMAELRQGMALVEARSANGAVLGAKLQAADTQAAGKAATLPAPEPACQMQRASPGGSEAASGLQGAAAHADEPLTGSAR